MLISKTFDASVICPAEQTCVVDEAIYDDLVAEFERLGGQLLDPDQVEALADLAFEPDGRVDARALGQSCVNLGAMGGFEVGRGREGAARAAAVRSRRAGRPPADPGEADARPRAWSARPRSSTAIAACELITEHGGLGHTSAVYATDDDGDRPLRRAGPHRPHPRQRPHRGRRPRRDLQLADADLLARLRHLGGLEHHRQRQLQEPAQREDRLAPPGASPVVPRPLRHLHQRRRDREPARGQGRARSCSSPTSTARPAASPTRCAATSRARASTSSPTSTRSPPRRRSQAGTEVLSEFGADCIVAVGGGSVLDAAKAMRLFHESPDVSLRELSLPFLDARKRVAHYPEVEHTRAAAGAADHRRDRLGGLARGRDQRRRAQGDPGRLLAGPRRRDRRPDPDPDDAARASPPTPASTPSPTRSRPASRSSPRPTRTPSACRRST